MRRGALLIVLMVFLYSCMAAPPADMPEQTPGEAADELLTEIRTRVFENDHRGARKSGLIYLDKFAGSSEEDEVRLITAKADVELGFLTEAGTILKPLIDSPSGAPGTEALLLMAGIHRVKGDFYDAAVTLLEGLSLEPSRGQEESARDSLREIVSLLPRQRLERLREEHGSMNGIDIVLEGCLTYAIEESDSSSIRMIREQLGSIDSVRSVPDRSVSRRVTSSEPGAQVSSTGVEAAVGLICPLTGRYAILGEAFLHGASVALKEAERRGMGGISLVVGDTKGNPLEAMKVTERMIGEEKVVAIVGGVLSASTISSAQAAQEESIVLLSPVATEAGIDGIGDHIFQSMTDSDTEIIALAHMACRTLGLTRIAMLAADNHRSRITERIFRANVERFGADLVVSDFYNEGSTDFLLNIERLREYDPEALFIASDTEDLILILPQLTFYEFGVQLLGSSSWNSRNLLRMAGRDMEGAVFPEAIENGLEEESLRSAAVFLDDQSLEVNRFSTGGYSGMKRILEVMAMSRESGRSLRDEMERSLENRQHRYVELLTGEGIVFNTIRGERIERHSVLKTGR